MEKPALRLDQDDFFYQEAAIPVINDIVEFLRSVKAPKSKNLRYIWEYPIDPDVWFDLWEDDQYASYLVKIKLELVDFDESHPGWNIVGEAGFSESSDAVIDVVIQLRSDLISNSDIVNTIESELYNVVPHEMHHLTQNNQPFQRVSCPLTASAKSAGNFEYFTSSCEIPAFLIGFRGEAYKSGRPIEELIDVYLNNQLRAGKISNTDIKSIRNKWMGHIKWDKMENESVLREWLALALNEQNVLAVGMCFPFAYQKAEKWFEDHFTPGARGRSIKRHPDLNDKSKFKVVHGTVTNKWKNPPKPVVHGWVEMGDLVFDDQTKITKPNGIDKEVYYDTYQPEIYKEFTAEETILNCTMKGGEGPWDDDLLAQLQQRDEWLQEKVQRGKGKNKRILYHINKSPALPQPKMKHLQDWDPKAIDPDTGERTGDMVNIPGTDNWQRHWLDSPVKSGVFLTPNPVDIAMNHGRSGNVYAYRVPQWVIEKSGGIHRYDHGSEVLIPEKVWNEAAAEIEFLGKSMSRDQLWDQIGDSQYGRGKTRQATLPSWLTDKQMADWKAQKNKFNLDGLRATRHPEDVIKMLTHDERKRAIEAIEAKRKDQPREIEKGPNDKKGIVIPSYAYKLDKKDEELLMLLKKHLKETLLREYISEVLSESRLSGRTIQGVLALLESHANNTWIFFDTETTGFDPNSGQLTEIGAVAVDPKSWDADASILGEFNEKVKLDSDTLKTITQQSNNPEDVKGKSVQDLLSMTRYGERGKQYEDEQAVLGRFFEFISSFPNPMLVAQNAAFDMKFVNVRSGGKIPKYPVLDTQQLMQGYLIPLLKTQAKAEEGDPQARKLLNKLYVRKGNWGYYSASMGVVSKAYGISIDEWHNALADVKMMMKMYRSVVETIQKGMETDISKEQGKFLAYQRKRKKKR
jgi:DNA polymerase III epsilon subunit-like protein